MRMYRHMHMHTHMHAQSYTLIYITHAHGKGDVHACHTCVHMPPGRRMEKVEAERMAGSVWDGKDAWSSGERREGRAGRISLQVRYHTYMHNVYT